MHVCTNYELSYKCKEFQHFDVIQKNEYTFVD